MIAFPTFTPATWETLKSWLVPMLAACIPLALFWLTQRSKKTEARRVGATEVENLYIGNAKDLFSTLQEELRSRLLRIGALEKEREQLRANLADERQMLEIIKQRHRDLVGFMTNSGIKVPDDVHV